MDGENGRKWKKNQEADHGWKENKTWLSEMCSLHKYLTLTEFFSDWLLVPCGLSDTWYPVRVAKVIFHSSANISNIKCHNWLLSLLFKISESSSVLHDAEIRCQTLIGLKRIRQAKNRKKEHPQRICQQFIRRLAALSKWKKKHCWKGKKITHIFNWIKKMKTERNTKWNWYTSLIWFKLKKKKNY